MGYGMNMHEAVFSISKDKVPDALTAVKAVRPAAGSLMWVDMDFTEAATLKQAMHCWRWQVEEDHEGNINNIFFEGEKAGDDELMFKEIAPYVTSGSYIEMHGEDGEMWRWKFEDGEFEEKYAEVVW